MKRYAQERALELLERLAGEVVRTSASADADAVHDLRVTIRRVSGCLRAFARYFPHKVRKRARRKLKQLMELAAAVRDRDIALALVGSAGVAAGAAMPRRLSAQRTRAARLLAVAARVWKEPMRIEAHRASGKAAAARQARRRLPKLAAEYFELGRHACEREDASPADLHAFRLATKRLRYTLELFRPCYGPGMEKRLEELRAIQTYLGELNDCAAARRLVVRVERPGGEDRQRVEQFLADRAIRKAAGFRRHWRTVFDASGREALWRRYLGR